MRKTARPAPLPVLPAEYHDLARGKLLEDWLAFIAGTHTEDPKLYVARAAAADAALAMLTKLRDAHDARALEAEPTLEQEIACARLSLASENKT
jgi:hypothetical protein